MHKDKTGQDMGVGRVDRKPFTLPVLPAGMLHHTLRKAAARRWSLSLTGMSSRWLSCGIAATTILR